MNLRLAETHHVAAPTFAVPHRRNDPLLGRWVVVSAHRTQRPWQGQREAVVIPEQPRYDPSCYLCPGNPRAGGAANPDYDTTFVFDNDYPALLPDVERRHAAPHPLLRAETQPGTCRVLCFHPRHDLTLSRMDVAMVRQVVDLWATQQEELSTRYDWVQIFENRGAAMGASNPHPHGQVWATTNLPEQPLREDRNQAAYVADQGTHLLLDYVQLELAEAKRLVVANDHWTAVVPYWATWPFETLLLPSRHVGQLGELRDDERDALAALIRELMIRYDNLFETPFPYSMGWHGAPGRGRTAAHWQLHGHVYPPLLRSASVRKFMVGYELLGDVQRDLTAEEAAGRLATVSAVHHLDAVAEDRTPAERI